MRDVRAHSVAAYVTVAVLAVLASLALLTATKIPWVVMLFAATIASGLFMIYARLDLGYWDPFAPIAFVVCWFFAAIVSLGFVGIGRWLKWPFFLKRAQVQSAP
jgi:hypothetical protein